MPDSLLDIRDAAAELGSGVAAALDAVSTTLASGTATPQQLGGLRAVLTGYRGDLADLRANLDAADVTTFQIWEDAAVTLQLWTWERSLRYQLITLAPKLRAAEEMTTKLITGSTEQVYVVKSGDTLQKIAARLLGNWQEWPRIAEANAITPGPLASGTRLVIPSRR